MFYCYDLRIDQDKLVAVREHREEKAAAKQEQRAHKRTLKQLKSDASAASNASVGGTERHIEDRIERTRPSFTGTEMQKYAITMLIADSKQRKVEHSNLISQNGRSADIVSELFGALCRVPPDESPSETPTPSYPSGHHLLVEAEAGDDAT